MLMLLRLHFTQPSGLTITSARATPAQPPQGHALRALRGLDPAVLARQGSAIGLSRNLGLGRFRRHSGLSILALAVTTLLAGRDSTFHHRLVKLRLAIATFAAALSVGFSASAWAACSSPAGQTGDQAYNSSSNVMAYCDGTNWISMAGGVAVNIGGADTYVQYNSGGTAFGGSSAFTWNTGTNTLTATNMAGTGAVFTNLTGTLQTATQPNITSVGTLTGLTMGGDIAMGTHNISGGGTATFTTLAGTLSTAAQPNVTSLGTLTGLTVNGIGTFTTVTSTNIYASSVSGTTGVFGSLTVGGVVVTGGASADRITSGTVTAIAEQTSGTVRISGTLALNNTGNEACDTAHAYSLRINQATKMLQMCRP